MKEIQYNIERVLQVESSDCVQACASQVLKYYGATKSIDDIKKEVPVSYDSQGHPVGSSVGHIAAYFAELGFRTTMHVADVWFLDRTWIGLGTEELLAKIEKRVPFLKHGIYEQDLIKVIADGYVLFLKKGGILQYPVVDESYLYLLLQRGPIYAVVNVQFLYDQPRLKYDEATKQYEPSDIEGVPLTHAILIDGYKDGQFHLVDPDDPKDKLPKWVAANKLVGAYYLSDINLDCMLVTLEK